MSKIISPNTLHWLLYSDYTLMQLGLFKVSKLRNKAGEIQVTITVNADHEEKLEEILQEAAL